MGTQGEDVAVSRIGASLRAARARVDWSREALAYHSGVSWSAIAQIESGRRQDVRLSTLSALAEALGVSVDYLIGTTATLTPRMLEHRLLTYGSDEQFLAGTVPFLVEGVERSDCLLAVTTAARIEHLQDALDDRAERVEFADWTDWYRSPKDVLSRYDAYVKRKFAAGATWFRIVGEAAWAGESDAEIATWTRYESVVNLAFASAPVTFLCTYDERAFPAKVVDDARRTHPEVAHETGASASPAYRKPEEFLLQPPTTFSAMAADHRT